MKEYYRYIEPNGKFYKYVTSNCREGALQMLSFLIDDSGYGSASETYYSLKKFEKIDYYEIPDGANILYYAEKNRVCVSGTSEGPTYTSGTDIGWTKNTRQPMLNLFYVLPYKVFVVANSEEAAYSKLFPIESIIKKKDRIRFNRATISERFNGLKNIEPIGLTSSRIYLWETIKHYDKSYFEGFLPENVTIITEPTLDYDRWSNFITGYFFRRTGHQERFSEQQFNEAIKNGVLSTYDLIGDEIPDVDMLYEYQSKNKIIFEALFPLYNVYKTRSLSIFLESKKSDISFTDYQGTILAILSSTGECLEVEDRTADIIKTGNFGNLADYEVYDIKKGYKYIQTVRRQDIDNDLPF